MAKMRLLYEMFDSNDSGTVGYAEVAQEPFESWAPPAPQPYLERQPISDAYGHPLTWGTVRAAHEWLVRHATCESSGFGPAGWDSDGDGEADPDDPTAGRVPCYCQYSSEGADERSANLAICRAWPGPACGVCWAASCLCGYTFETIEDARGRWPNGRLRCSACAMGAAAEGREELGG